jgi:hypothetical protein
MAADHVPRPLIPDDRLDIAKLFDAAAKLFIFSISRLQVNPGIVGCCINLIDWHDSDVHIYHLEKKFKISATLEGYVSMVKLTKQLGGFTTMTNQMIYELLHTLLSETLPNLFEAVKYCFWYLGLREITRRQKE